MIARMIYNPQQIGGRGREEKERKMSFMKEQVKNKGRGRC
jgi:hypothetical protein